MLQQEFYEYLRDGNFETFMKAWKLQFQKYGTLGGTAVIFLNQENREDIENLLGLNTKNLSQIKLSWRKFKQILSKTRYADVDFVNVLELYFDKELITQKTKQERNRQRTDQFFEKLLEETLSDITKHWIEDILQSKSSIYQEVLKNKGNEKQEYKDIHTITKAIDQLPVYQNRQISLAVFASQITGDPHAFDQKTRLYFYLTQALRYISSIKDGTFIKYTNTELLTRFGLFKEDINNFCSIYGFSALKEKKSHPGWEGFYQSKESWNVNLNNVLNIDEIDLKNIKKIYIVENPSIFEALVKKAQNKNITSAFICSYGQPTQVVYALLNKLQKQNTPMFYAGDFDPEGLLIAQKLLNQYPNLDLWLYTEDDYFAQASDIKASAKRRKMFLHLSDLRLIEIAELIENCGVGYQENMIDKYLQDIKKI